MHIVYLDIFILILKALSFILLYLFDLVALPILIYLYNYANTLGIIYRTVNPISIVSIVLQCSCVFTYKVTFLINSFWHLGKVICQMGHMFQMCSIVKAIKSLSDQSRENIVYIKPMF